MYPVLQQHYARINTPGKENIQSHSLIYFFTTIKAKQSLTSFVIRVALDFLIVRHIDEQDCKNSVIIYYFLSF